MESTTSNSHRSVFMIVLCCCCCWVSHTCADCSLDNYTLGTQYASNVETVMDNLIKASKQAAAFNISVVGNGNDTVRGLFQCRGDKTKSECFACAQSAKSDMHQNCPQSSTGSSWTNETCFMRYRNDYFINRLDIHYPKMVDCGDGGNVSDPQNFNQVVRELLTNLSVQAVSSFSTRYASGSANSTILTVYGMVQCWKDLSTDNCKTCLDDNLAYMFKMHSGIRGVEIVSNNCLTQYKPDEFFRPTNPPAASFPNSASSPPPKVSGGSKSKVKVIVVAVAGSFFMVLLICGWFFLAKRERKTLGVLTEEGSILRREEDLIVFNAADLKKATNDFHEDLKLGEGGFGTVYKGTLPNGTHIAVKKLSSRSTQTQGPKEFINEIKLLIKIQHRNLVSLRGCCIDGSQKMLVYEYLSNKSMDKVLFDPNKKIVLDWHLRFHIIIGVAKGLVYLHEDSKYKIIHRDIKAANILLDDDFNPEIADFGLAKLFPEDQTNMHTRVAGTYGYMSPEYAMKGQLSTKADVYSFGVLTLEIISGRKNRDFDVYSGQSILTKIWRLFQQGNVGDIVDKSMASNISYEQVIRCIHVGFLCTQIDASLRPPMSTVFSMLTSASLTLPEPAEPAFLSYKSDNDDRSNAENQSSLTVPR